MHFAHLLPLAQQDAAPLFEYSLAPLWEDSGIPLAVMGVLVVFAALLLIVIFITILPHALSSVSLKQPQLSAPEPARERELPEETLIVIAAAVAATIREPHRIVRIGGQSPEESRLVPRGANATPPIAQHPKRPSMSNTEYLMTKATELYHATAFGSMEQGNVIMMLIGGCFIYLAIAKHYEPLLLVPIGFGIIVGNIPSVPGMELSVYAEGTVLRYLYFGVEQGVYPPLIFLGIGAMTDFSTMLSNPKLILLGAAAQVGVFLTYLGALCLSFTPQEAGAIGIIGGADGPTAIFLSSRLAPELLGAIAIAAYSYMALVPVIQPPIMRLFTTRQERLIRMKPSRHVSRRERIVFPIAAFLICATLAPGAIVLIGMLFFGNLLKECTVTDRLALTARTAMIDVVTILLGFCVGASTNAQYFLKSQSILIFGLGALAFAVATMCGVLFAKFMNLFLKEKINPLIGAAGVSAVPDSARVAQVVGQEEDPTNFLLMHAMLNVAGVIGSAIAAGVLWSQLAK